MATIDQDDRDNQKTSYFLDRRKRRKLYEERSEAIKQVGFQHQLEVETSPIDDPEIPFVRLLGGNESVKAAETRWKLYNEAWGFQEEKINKLLDTANTQVLKDIENFILQPWDDNVDARIDTSIILPGSNIANHIRLFSQIKERVKRMTNVHTVSLTSKACPNLKTALKIIVGTITEGGDEDEEVEQEEDDEEEDESDGEDLRFDKRLRYDLDILADWCKKQAKTISNPEDLRVIISVEDADSFDITILTGLIKMLQSYISQIPLKLMLSVATSLEVFQEKLPRSCIRLLKGTPFHAQMSDGIMRILDATLFSFDRHTLMLGPKLFKNLVHRQMESIESVDAFISSLKFIFMSHYYSNPFSIFSQCGADEDNELFESEIKPLISKSHIQAIRMTNSFKTFISQLVEAGDCEEARLLLEDDQALKERISDSVINFRSYSSQVLAAVDIVIALQVAAGETPSSKIDLYIGALSSELWNESILADLIETVASGGLECTKKLLEKLCELSDKGGILRDLYDVIENEHGQVIQWYTHNRDSENLINPEDYQEVSAKSVAQVCDALNTSLRPFNNYLLYEAFVTDSAKLQEDVFLPTQRPALELALSEPIHYLGAPGSQTGIRHEPHLSILYQLYRESSVFINSFDYYTAFKEMLPEPSEDENKAEWEKKTLAWFLQGIAELKLLGIVRDSKRKFECVEKISWKDL